jgi:glycosyltransferase involved in cell wall biosynthesis
MEMRCIKKYAVQKTLDNSSGNYPVSKEFLPLLNKVTKTNVVDVIPSGTDTSIFRHLKKEQDEKIIIFVGSLIERKGVKYLIEGFADFIDKMKTDSFGLKLKEKLLLWIIGDGYLKDDLIMLSKRLGISDSVIFHGDIKNSYLPHYYRQADICILPSLFEGVAGTLRESLAMEIPTIATDVGGTPELINDNTGYLIRPRSRTEISRAIKNVFSDYDKAKSRAKKGAKIVIDNYSWDKIIPKWEKIFEKRM